VTNAVHRVEHQLRQDDLSMRFGMPTPSHGPQKSLTLQEVYAWLYALQCKRLELRMQAIVQTDYLVRPVAFEEMSALLDQALEEIRVVTEALRERREAAHRESMRLLELSTEQRALRRNARETFFPLAPTE